MWDNNMHFVEFSLLQSVMFSEINLLAFLSTDN